MAYVPLSEGMSSPTQEVQESPFETPSTSMLVFWALVEVFPILVTTYTVVKSQCLLLRNAFDSDTLDPMHGLVFLFTLLIPPLFMGLFSGVTAVTVFEKRACYYWFLKRGSFLIKFKDRSYFKSVIFYGNLLGALISLGAVFHMSQNLLHQASLSSWINFATIVFSYAAYFTLTYSLFFFESSLLTLSAAFRDKTSFWREHLVVVEEDVLCCCINRIIAMVPSRAQHLAEFKQFQKEGGFATADFFQLFLSVKKQCDEEGHHHERFAPRDSAERGRYFSSPACPYQCFNQIPHAPAKDLVPILRGKHFLMIVLGVAIIGIEVVGGGIAEPNLFP